MTETAMNFGRSLLVAALLTAPLVPRAHAIELNGTWASDPALCGKIFVKNGSEVGFGPLSDLYGSGFIIEGNRIRGKIARCTIKSRKEDGATVHLTASCSTNVAVEEMEFSLKIIDDNTLGRIYPGMSAMQVNFHRCPP
jgi:hypothetical protein